MVWNLEEILIFHCPLLLPEGAEEEVDERDPGEQGKQPPLPEEEDQRRTPVARFTVPARMRDVEARLWSGTGPGPGSTAPTWPAGPSTAVDSGPASGPASVTTLYTKPSLSKLVCHFCLLKGP